MRIIDFIAATNFLNSKLVITQEFDHKNIISGKVTIKDTNTILNSAFFGYFFRMLNNSERVTNSGEGEIRIRDVEKENYTLPLMSFKISQSELELAYKPLYLLQKNKKTQ